METKEDIIKELGIPVEYVEWLEERFDCVWGENCTLYLKTSKIGYNLNGSQVYNGETFEEFKERWKKRFQAFGVNDKDGLRKLGIGKKLPKKKECPECGDIYTDKENIENIDQYKKCLECSKYD